ncbi:MAG: CPBP family intramembrane glutamic endopeptidase [Acidobacteriaceae bacterium]
MTTPMHVPQTDPEKLVASVQLQQKRLTVPQRWLSLAELAVGAAIVIGHNVYHVIPNEVPILFVIALLSLRLRGGSWSATGLAWPVSWRRTVLLALAAAALRILLGALVIRPLTAHFWRPPVAPAGSDEIQGHPLLALGWLLFIWTFAAFGEEIGYRAYLLTRAAEAGGLSKAAWGVTIVVSSVLFGFGHYYKGPSGMVDSGIAGIILAAVFVLSRRNLWACVLAHGFIDTVAVVTAFLGWQT